MSSMLERLEHIGVDLKLMLIESSWKPRYRYQLAVNGRVIFDGDDYRPSPFADDEEIVAGLLTFLTLQPRDTDAEYFENYTQEQLEFAQSSIADEIRMLLWEEEGRHGRGDE